MLVAFPVVEWSWAAAIVISEEADTADGTSDTLFYNSWKSLSFDLSVCDHRTCWSRVATKLENAGVGLTLVLGHHVESRPYGTGKKFTRLWELVRQMEEFTEEKVGVSVHVLPKYKCNAKHVIPYTDSIIFCTFPLFNWNRSYIVCPLFHDFEHATWHSFAAKHCRFEKLKVKMSPPYLLSSFHLRPPMTIWKKFKLWNSTTNL